MPTSAKLLRFLTALGTITRARSPAVVWLHSPENLIWEALLTQPRRRDAGGQDSPAAYGSSLQPAGKEKHPDRH